MKLLNRAISPEEVSKIWRKEVPPEVPPDAFNSINDLIASHWYNNQATLRFMILCDVLGYYKLEWADCADYYYEQGWNISFSYANIDITFKPKN